jgi:S-adenosylmethionine:diacylglycerol 3-amino-3-carboxypropyl transferase
MLRAALRVVIGRRRLEQLFTLDPGSQRDYFEREWNTPGWRMLVRLGCSRWMLGNRLDPSWFEHGDGPSSFGRHFTALAAHAVGHLPARTNYFLAGMLLGQYLDEVEVPDYLRPENFETIRQRLDRLQPVTADVGEALSALPARSVDCLALSNVFEYGPVELFARAMREVARVARPGARLSLRNLLAARLVSDDMAFAVDGSLSERLRGADRGFIYSRFQAATLRGS